MVNEQIDVDSKTAPSTAEVKTSIDILKKVKPSQNIAMEKSNDENRIDQTKIELVFEKSETGPSEKSTAEPAAAQADDAKPKSPSGGEATVSSDATTPSEAKKEEALKEGAALASPAPHLMEVKKSPQTTALKNRSDIFSLNDSEKVASNIFSVAGVPSRTRQHQKAPMNASTSSHIFGKMTKGATASISFVPDKKPVKTPSVTTTVTASSTGSKMERNPLTGAGVNSNDEFKGKSQKKKVDGNPVLGLGYKESGPAVGNRIPPGGYSKGLW